MQSILFDCKGYILKVTNTKKKKNSYQKSVVMYNNLQFVIHLVNLGIHR